MQPDDEIILRMAKEIIVKFIELGRVSPDNFDENFRGVYWTLKDTLVSARWSDVTVRAPAVEPPEEDSGEL